jgi:hypothetical protein
MEFSPGNPIVNSKELRLSNNSKLQIESDKGHRVFTVFATVFSLFFSP